jgi:hypothetical protein
MKKKYTIIVIGDKRKIGSFEITAATLVMALSVMIGLVLILVVLIMTGAYTKITAKIDSPDRQMTSANHQPENVSQESARQSDRGPRLSDALSRRLTIENFQAHYDSAKKLVSYKFGLKNPSQETAVSGHIFVVLKDSINITRS